MAGITLSEFKGQVQDVARPNRFLLEIGFNNFNERTQYLVKSASIPSRTIGEIPLSWQGMQTKIAGDPTFDDFSVTFINDYEGEARSAIEFWMKEIANQDLNNRLDPESYRASSIIVTQLGRDGEPLRNWFLDGCWPKSLDQIDLSTDSNDTASEFSVTFNVDRWDTESFS